MYVAIDYHNKEPTEPHVPTGCLRARLLPAVCSKRTYVADCLTTKELLSTSSTWPRIYPLLATLLSAERAVDVVESSPLLAASGCVNAAEQSSREPQEWRWFGAFAPNSLA